MSTRGKLPWNAGWLYGMAGILVVGLGSGCFRHPKVEVKEIECESDDNCPDGYFCAVRKVKGGCQAITGGQRDGGFDTDAWLLGDARTAEDTRLDVPPGGEAGARPDLPLDVDGGSDATAIKDAITIDAMVAMGSEAGTQPDRTTPVDQAEITADTLATTSDTSALTVDSPPTDATHDTPSDSASVADAPSTDTATSLFTVKITKDGNGGGSVSSPQAGINCGDSCSALVPSGTSITLQATPAAGVMFMGWSGAACPGLGDCTFSVATNTEVKATFALGSTKHTLTVVKAGTGADVGTVKSSPDGLDCGTICAADFTGGTQVVLTPSAPIGSIFTGWSAVCPGTSTCAITINADTTVIANFSLAKYTLNVSMAGTGTGVVSSEPAGIDCGSACAYDFGAGATVVLKAAATGASVFSGWSGTGCSGTSASCSVSLTGAKTAIATFRQVTPLSCGWSAMTTECASGSLPDLNLGGGLQNSTCRERCGIELAGAGVANGCWILDGSGNCLCRNGTYLSETGSLVTGGSCTKSASSVACEPASTNVADCAGGSVTSATTTSSTTCRDLCRSALDTNGCWTFARGACNCRDGSLTLGYDGGVCTQP